ncbi:RNA polymerase sigma factor [Reinekea sp.]|jgi:RNA polymerase sigma factor (sigma-70 family)|uniref:RNA polymerase sigma factor n=1 Tax=Reinekea sp. TaxID=1970455 RepID=UPI003989E726
MNLFNKRKLSAIVTDENLVMFSLGGDRDAFCQIVDRYQNLLCSLAYSSVGQIQLSEDIAQEVFIEAWKSLASLEEPRKLKAWLCGILRFRISAHFRKSSKQPTDFADEYTLENEIADQNSELEQKHINQQQQDLMWQVLSEIDETYREPLVLFYRQQQSIETVANELELSIDTVKQRLSRGRKLLKQAMLKFVEDGLKRTMPSLVFTSGVMSAISTLAPPAKAATLAAGAVKSSSMVTLSTQATLLAVSSGLISSFLGLRAAFDQSRTNRERKLALKVVLGFLALTGLYIVAVLGFKKWALSTQEAALTLTVMSHLSVLAFVLGNIILVRLMFNSTRRLRAQERIFEPDAFKHPIDKLESKRRELRSKHSLLGIPLFHFQFGMSEHKNNPAIGWIATGSQAYGILMAWGGLAVAPISVGIISVGVFTVGNVGIGLFACGTAAIGLVAFGASSIAYKAYASLTALGWDSAMSNGFSVAKNAAIGTIAYAEQVNNNIAAEIGRWQMFENHYTWLLVIIAIAVITPALFHSRKVRRRMRVK